MNQMKNGAKTTSINPIEIVGEAIADLDTETRSRMLSEDIIKRTLRNQRSNKNPPEPNNIKDLLISSWFIFTIKILN